jgi:hypothetical protein
MAEKKITFGQRPTKSVAPEKPVVEKPKKPARSSVKAKASSAAVSAAASVKTPTAKPASTTQAVQVQESAHSSPRFQFFLIDSGWESPVSQAVRKNIHMITRFQNNDPLYILTKDQSTSLLSRHPHLIGKDPILIARDTQAKDRKNTSDYHGFHFNMGLIHQPDKAIEGLRIFLHFLATHRNSINIELDIKDKLHREGITGAIEVLRVGSEGLV